MKKFQLLFAVCAMACAFALVGCGEDTGGTKTKVKTDTPKASLESMAKAIDNQDMEAFKKLVDTSKEANVAMVEMMESSIALQKGNDDLIAKIKEKYGEEAANKESTSSMKKSNHLSAEVLEKAEVKIADDGKTATVTIDPKGDGKKQEIQMIKVDGGWKADFSGMDGMNVEEMKKIKPMFTKMEELNKKYLQLVDEKASYDEFKAAKQAEMMKSFGG